MSLDFRPDRDVYVIFHDDTQYRFSKYMTVGFKHAFIIERSALGWICFDASRTNIAVDILPADYFSEVMQHFHGKHKGATILHLTIQPTNSSNYPRPGIISCVSSVQYYLGIYWPWIFTPHSLYTKLKNKPPTHIKVDDYVGKISS